MGSATARVMRSTLWMAKVFGVSSPRMMCRAVMMAKPRARAIVCPTGGAMPSHSVTGRISFDTAGSPIQPKPREARVMPSWVTDSDTSR